MHAVSISTLLVFAALVMPATAIGQTAPANEHPAYPSKGQSAQQQQIDEAECHNWAVQQSGYDPANPQAVVKAQPAPVTGSGARVGGAAAGATVGAIGGNDVGNAAVKGAVAGAVVKRSRNRRAARQQNEAIAQNQQSEIASYQNARSACLEGRGYSVK